MTALRGRALLIYLFLCAVWGSTWLVIKVGLQNLPPLRFAGYRMALACLLLAPFAFRRGGRLPTRREAAFMALNGFLQIGVSYAFVFTATQWIASGLAALLFATFPIWVGLFAHFLLPEEPLTARTLLAAGLGVAGVAVIEGSALTHALGGEAGPLLAGGALILASAVVSGYSNVLVKKHLGGVAPARNVWGQTLVGATFLLLCAGLFERDLPANWTPGAVAALLYLALFGTALTFVGLFWLIPRVPVSVVGTIPLVATLIAVLLGAWILNEKLSARILLGGALILAGVLLAAARRLPPTVSAA